MSVNWLYNYIPKNNLKTTWEGFPGGTVVKNPPANAGDMGSSPGPGRSHMLCTCSARSQSNEACAPQLLSLRSRAHKPQLLSLCATTTEACVPRAHAPQQEKPPRWEDRAPQQKSSPRSLQLEKTHAQQQRPNAAKNK